MSEEQKMCSYLRRLLLSVFLIIAVSLPTLIKGNFAGAMVAPWFLVGVICEVLNLFPGVEFGQWPIINGVCVLLIVAIAARWYIVSIIVTTWFIINILAIYWYSIVMTR